MSELFFNERYAEFLASPDETESDALGVLSSLVSQVELAKKVPLPQVNAAELILTIAQIELLFAHYKILKATASDLYLRYQEEKQSYLKSLSESSDTSDEITEEDRQKMAQIIKIKALSHKYSLAQLAPAALIMAIKKSKEFTPTHAENVARELSSYRVVKVSGKDQRVRAEATADRVDEQIIEALKQNTETNTLVINAPPGSGKTTFLNNLELRLRLEGWEVVQINFDKVIAEYFKLLQQETREWSRLIGEEFDKSFSDIEQLIRDYYPEDFSNKRVIVLIDTLGYRIDKMNYGLWLIRKLLRPLIEEDKALVLSIIPQPAVVEKAKKERESVAIDAKNVKNAAETLKKSQGAPAGAVIRHHHELGKKVEEAHDDKQFQSIIKNSKLDIFKDIVPEQELEQMRERLAYAILIRNILRIFKNWWFAFNLFKEKDKAFELPQVKK